MSSRRIHLPTSTLDINPTSIKTQVDKKVTIDDVLVSLGLSSKGIYFTFELGDFALDSFGVVSFDYQESYNELYELTLLVVVREDSGAEIVFSDLLDSRGSFKVWRDGHLLREIKGIVSFVEEGDRGFHHRFYRLKVVPHLYQLSLRQNSRIFQLKNLEEIIREIFEDHPLVFCRFDFDVIAHQRREYCVQYRETDFAFLQRLLGEEGIFFYFEHNEEGLETIVFVDDWRRLDKKNALQFEYNPHTQANKLDRVINQFQFTQQLRPHQVQLRDYTFKNPSWVADYASEKSDGIEENTLISPYYHHYDYPGRYKDSRGEFYAQTRLESLRRDANIGKGKGSDIQLRLGCFVSLNSHPNSLFNRLWQPIAVHHHGEQPQVLREDSQFIQGEGKEGSYLISEFECIPREQNYRANFMQKPLMHGCQTAVVVGPAGEEIFTDDQGRVKVQFHWDRYGSQDDHSSCWIRVSSPWAGQGWGMLSLPRVGQEVIVSFQEGDPDQPIITGRVYNAQQIPPGHLPQSKTQMYIKSKTYKGEGYNSLMFDDATKRELLGMHAERDMETLVKHDQRNHIKNNRTLTVNGSQTTQIDRGRSTQITTGNDIKTVLAGNDIETISLLKSTTAKEIFQYAKDRIELEVGEQTSITMDNQQILLRFGKSTILMNEEGIWLDGKHIGLQEKDIVHENRKIREAAGKYSNKLDLYNIFGSPKEDIPYIVKNSEGEIIQEGILDEMGRTDRIYSDIQEVVTVVVTMNRTSGKTLDYEIPLLEAKRNGNQGEYRQAYHLCQKDESLVNLAQILNVSLSDVKIANNLADYEEIFPQEICKLPQKSNRT